MELKIAALQTAGTMGDVAANFAELRAAARTARAAGAELLITPETFITGYNIGDRMHPLAEQELVASARVVARDEDIALIVGLPEFERGQYFNSAVFIDELGEVRTTYRKTHLFGDLDRGYFTPGDELVSTVDYRGVRVAVMICYDVEFPEVVRAAADAGAHLIAVPTAQMEPFDFIAEQLIRTRAWENQVYVAYANHDGAEGTLRYVGRSQIVDPAARVLASALHGNHILYATVDTDVVAAAQAANPYITDRRRDLYAAGARQSLEPAGTASQSAPA
jgi:predicted amidohydrolase